MDKEVVVALGKLIQAGKPIIYKSNYMPWQQRAAAFVGSVFGESSQEGIP